MAGEAFKVGRDGIVGEVSRIEQLRPSFQKSRMAMEQVIVLARRMSHGDAKGSWGQWSYDRRGAEGSLYVPFGQGGLAVVSLLVGWDMLSDCDLPLSKAQFIGSWAYWTGRHQRGSWVKDFKYAMLVRPGGEGGGA